MTMHGSRAYVAIRGAAFAVALIVCEITTATEADDARVKTIEGVQAQPFAASEGVGRI
jgi:hypothetical protein